MLALAAVMPMGMLVLSYFFLLESPHWLLAQKRYSDAKEVVWRMALYKGNVPPNVFDELTSSIHSHPCSPEHNYIVPPDEDERAGTCCSADARNEIWETIQSVCRGCSEDMSRFSLLFSDKFFTTTMLMSYISFVSNFAYYGMIYGLPDTLKKEQPAEKEGAWSPAAGVFFSAVFEIPGVFIAILLGTTVGRRVNMTISFGCTTLALAAVVRVLQKGDMEGFGLVAVFCVKLFIASVFIVVYLYLLECYPTKFRATGLAFCMVIGRTGAFACPFLYDGLVLLGIHHMWFFIVMGVLCLGAAIISLLLPYETKDSQLMEDDAPIEEPLLTPRGGSRPETARSSRQVPGDAGDRDGGRYNTMAEWKSETKSV